MLTLLDQILKQIQEKYYNKYINIIQILIFIMESISLLTDYKKKRAL